jgi:glyoxylase-like metal-dependent hydrolase (beta-lactamase superfamily II)
MPPVEQVREGIFAVPLAMPHIGLPFSLSYLIEGDGRELHLIDSGLDSDDNWAALRSGIESIGHVVDDLATLTITHLHADHAGLAARVRAASGARVRMHREDAKAMRARATFIDADSVEQMLDTWAVPADARPGIRESALTEVAAGPPVIVDDMLEGGDSLAVAEREVGVIHTPGHTRGHITLVLHHDRLLFTGDHLLPTIHSGVGLGGRFPDDDPLGDYLRSLASLLPFGEYEACPGHGYRFGGVAGRCSAARVHHLRRTNEVRAILADSPDLTVWAVASQVGWTAGWSALRGSHLMSALGQTAMHMALGERTIVDDRGA